MPGFSHFRYTFTDTCASSETIAHLDIWSCQTIFDSTLTLVNSVWVEPEYRRRGLGTRLLNHMHSKAPLENQYVFWSSQWHTILRWISYTNLFTMNRLPLCVVTYVLADATRFTFDNIPVQKYDGPFYVSTPPHHPLVDHLSASDVHVYWKSHASIWCCKSDTIFALVPCEHDKVRLAWYVGSYNENAFLKATMLMKKRTLVMPRRSVFDRRKIWDRTFLGIIDSHRYITTQSYSNFPNRWFLPIY